MTFKGSLNYNSPRYALFVTNSERFANLGLSSYDKKSLEAFLKDDAIKADAVLEITDVDSEDEDELNAIVDKVVSGFTAPIQVAGEENKAYYYKFDQNKNNYVKTEINDSIADLTTYWEQTQKDIPLTVADKADLIKDIQNSLNGCLFFRVNFDGKPTIDTTVDPEDMVKVYFRSADNYSDAREMIINGDPKIAAIPRRPTGGKYDFERTIAVQSEGTEDSAANIGRFISSVSNDTLLSQRVASKLRLSYNKSLGYFESGTQTIIVRLLSDLPAPELKDVAIDDADQHDFDKMYDPNAEEYYGGFTTGFALPLSVHNGNPNTFGPNVVGSRDEKKKERIRVVNRATASFSKGDIVMCSLIDNEWIVHFSGGTESVLEPVTFSTGKWSFIKMMANSDAYFRDQRWYDTGESKWNIFYQHGSYATTIREKYYFDLNNRGDDLLGINRIYDVAKMNNIVIHTAAELRADNTLIAGLTTPTDPDIKPSQRYIQSTSFDNLGSHMGGSSEIGNVFGRTNRRVNPDTTSTEAEAEFATELPLFWGATFADGYNATQCRALTTPAKTFLTNGDGNYFGDSRLMDVDAHVGTHGLATTYMFAANNRDFSFSQIPADVALNAPPSGDNGFPIESIALLQQKEKANGVSIATYNNFLSDPKRLSWLSTDDAGVTGIYDLKPNTSTTLDFIPLSFAMAGSPDIATKYQEYGESYNTWDMCRSILQDTYRTTRNLFGKLFTRNIALIGSGPFDGSTAGINGPGNPTAGNIFRWDKYITRSAPGAFTGTPFGYNNGEEGANFVGIIAARNTFRLAAGGSINFESDYFIGLNDVSTGSINPITGKPIGFSQWGSTDTRPSAMFHTSLYVKVFDHWPEVQTIYDARYFSPLHFCAGKAFSAADTESVTGTPYDETWTPGETDNTSKLRGIDYPRSIDQTKYDIDFRVPTYGSPVGGSDNTIIPVDVKIDQYGSVEPREALRPQDEWRVNTVCRGMMVSSQGGFKHFKRTIGLDPSSLQVVAAGTGFVNNQEITLDDSKSVILILNTDEAGGITGATLKDKGKDFLTTDFASSAQINDVEVFGFRKNVESEAGDNATLIFTQGVVYDRVEETDYPKQHGSMQQLTPASQVGYEGPIEGRKTGSISISNPSSDNQYDAFYYHVNDVSHVDMFAQGSGPYSFSRSDDSTNREYYVTQSNARLQYVSLNITSS